MFENGNFRRRKRRARCLARSSDVEPESSTSAAAPAAGDEPAPPLSSQPTKASLFTIENLIKPEPLLSSAASRAAGAVAAAEAAVTVKMER